MARCMHGVLSCDARLALGVALAARAWDARWGGGFMLHGSDEEVLLRAPVREGRSQRKVVLSLEANFHLSAADRHRIGPFPRKATATFPSHALAWKAFRCSHSHVKQAAATGLRAYAPSPNQNGIT